MSTYLNFKDQMLTKFIKISKIIFRPACHILTHFSA